MPPGRPIACRATAEGRYVADVFLPDGHSMYTTDEFESVGAAVRAAQDWEAWFDDLPHGRTSESIYYILAIPEVWPGPVSRSLPYSGLNFKIGRARNVRQRVKNLRTGTSAQLIVHALEPGNSNVETQRHHQFAADRRQGEWFASSPQLVRHVFDVWSRNRAMFPEDQAAMAGLMQRADILEATRQVFAGPPDMINPSLGEPWRGNVLIDLVYANPVWKRER